MIQLATERPAINGVNRHRRKTVVAYDILRLYAGGLNGGIKVHHYEFLRVLARNHSDSLILKVVCQPEVRSELEFLLGEGDHQIHVLRHDPSERLSAITGPDSSPRERFWTGDGGTLLPHLGADLLYCGFGQSPLRAAEVPRMSLVVDCLHSDLPLHLPTAEVAYREQWFTETVANSQRIQTNSRFCTDRLEANFEQSKGKTFHLHLPLHERFRGINSAPLPPEVAHSLPYVFYPANHWPHKNHEGLLVAMRSYLACVPDEEGLTLVLTGFREERSDVLQRLARALRIESKVRFLGHVSAETLKSLWTHCQGLIFPSLYEGFGLPLWEAMAFRKPIACSNLASLPEIAHSNCHFFDPRQPLQIADALHQLDSGKLRPTEPPTYSLDEAVNALRKEWTDLAAARTQL